MMNNTSLVPFITQRESGILFDLRSSLFNKRLNAARNLYRRDLVCHFGCVNAIEFSNNGELLISGGDDRRVMLWQFGKAILDQGKPEAMKAVHQSNIFCLGITNDNRKIYSGGNDDIVIVHDLETKSILEVLRHQRAVCSLSINPFDEYVISTAGNDGRLLLFDTRQSVHESMVISRSRRAFHGVSFHPQQSGILVSANARDGTALWDLRSPKHPMIRYLGSNGTCQNSMSVCFNAAGTLVLALRRRLPPVLYAVHSPDPLVEFYHQDYYNSCTMKSCTFAGEGDRFVLSGSDDFNLYMWRVPNVTFTPETLTEQPHMVLYGHRSIVNQVRYNPHYCLIASSGVEKIIKIWSGLQYPEMRGALLEEAQGSDNPREMYSHEDYVMLVHRSGQYITHNYAEQSTLEDPRMMAFFDSLVQRELECLAETTDSLADSSPPRSPRRREPSTDTELLDYAPLPTKRASTNSRTLRGPSRLARLSACRYPKGTRLQKRCPFRRSKAWHGAGVSARGTTGSGVSSDRTDSDEPAQSSYRTTNAISRPLRRRINMSRSCKRKSKTSFRKFMNIKGKNGLLAAEDSSDNNSDRNLDENLTLPSTSSGYRGQSSSTLFRIAEVDSDDDQSLASRPISPGNPNSHQISPNNLISIVPTPINGSRDTLGDSLNIEPLNSDSNSPPTVDARTRSHMRRSKRNGRLSKRHSVSSESPPPKEHIESNMASVSERLSPTVGYSRSVARLMNETNESELESSCSTEGSVWPASGHLGTPDSGVGTFNGSSTRRGQPLNNDVSDDTEFQAVKFRHKVKRVRRNYRKHLDSDSN